MAEILAFIMGCMVVISIPSLCKECIKKAKENTEKRKLKKEEKIETEKEKIKTREIIEKDIYNTLLNNNEVYEYIELSKIVAKKYNTSIAYSASIIRKMADENKIKTERRMGNYYFYV